MQVGLKAPRQPLLWAALAFASGIVAGTYAWRPTLWWVLATITFIVAGGYFVARRVWLAFLLALGAIFLAGALAFQLNNSNPQSDMGAVEFAGDEEVLVTAHVLHEGEIHQASFGGVRQSVDLETEAISRGPKTIAVTTGVRVGIYGKEAEQEYSAVNSQVPMRLYRYGQRLRFSARLRPPRNFANPGAFDYRGYLAEHGIFVLASTKNTKIEVLPGFVGSRLRKWREAVHRSIVSKIHATWRAEDAALIDAAVVGESAFITPTTRMDFQRSGTYHILVVSGMNVSILAFVIFFVMRKLRISDLLASLFTVILAVGYAFVTDVGPPVWRAVLMLTVYLGVRLLYRGRSVLNAVGAAALAVMVVHPKSLLGASFQLTFLSVWILGAIVVPVIERTSAPYARGLRSLRSPEFDRTLEPRVAQMRLDLRMIAGRFESLLGEKISLALAALGAHVVLSTYEVLCVAGLMQAGLALPMAYYFHRATVMGIPANSLAVPLTGVLMPLAVMAVGLNYIWLPLAKIPAWGTAAALHGITGTIHSLGGFAIADHRVAMPEAHGIVITATALTIAMVLVWKRRNFAIGGVVLLAATGLWVSAAVPRPHIHRGVLEIAALDVGQGDSLLVISPTGKTLLIDAGGPVGGLQSEFDFGENVVSPYLWERRISRLDAVAITHGHSDHIGGMHAVLNNFRPRELWVGALPETTAVRALLDYAESLGIRVVHHVENDAFEFGGISVRVLSPPPNWQTSSQPRNNDSLVLRVEYGNSSALLEGDAETIVERRMVLSHNLHSDLLKVGHHGSATSSSEELIQAVRPRWAVISVGKGNRFGHPRLATLQRLQESGTATYRTDLSGAVSFYLDGRSVTPQLACLR